MWLPVPQLGKEPRLLVEVRVRQCTVSGFRHKSLHTLLPRQPNLDVWRSFGFGKFQFFEMKRGIVDTKSISDTVQCGFHAGDDVVLVPLTLVTRMSDQLHPDCRSRNVLWPKVLPSVWPFGWFEPLLASWYESWAKGSGEARAPQPQTDWFWFLFCD